MKRLLAAAMLVLAQMACAELVVYPEYPEQIQRDYAYDVRVVQGGERARLPVSTLPESAFIYLHDPDFAEPDGATMRTLVDTLGEMGTYNVLTFTLRCPGHDLADPETWRRVRAVADRAHGHGMQLVVDCDPRISRAEFLRRWPDAAQELAIVVTNGMPALAAKCPELNDHMSSHGQYAPTARREVPFPGGKVVVYTLRSADLFAPQILDYARELSRRARDAGADGALRDEWGFPPTVDPVFAEHRAFWYSARFAEAYAQETKGRDLLSDLPLMAFGPSGAEKLAAIDAYMRLVYRRNAEIEQDFFRASKEIFGPTAFVAKHPSWYPVIGPQEFLHDGLHWWAAPREWAQGDEVTPVPALCGMAKKCGGGVWLNEGYQDNPAKYAPLVWRYAVAGGRMVYHPVYPECKFYKGVPYPEWKVRSQRDVLEQGSAVAQRRVRLLSVLSDAPIDSPVALVFGHFRVMNWDDPAYGNWGWNDAFGVWKDGYAVDAYPSTELAAFRVDADGYLAVGRPRYQALVLRNLGAEDRAALARLIRGGKVKTKVFEGSEGGAAYLASIGATRQTPICASLPPEGWTAVYPPPDGTLVLTDGTVARLKASAPGWAGDPIEGVLEVGGARVEYAAEGVFAARLGVDGQLEAFAGGNVRRVKGPGFEKTFAVPRDLVMRRTADGWQDVTP